MAETQTRAFLFPFLGLKSEVQHLPGGNVLR